MPTPTKGPRLGGSPAHERIILANLASQLFEHRAITTTETRARRVRPLAEKLITKAKKGDLHSRRLVLRTITDKTIVAELFDEIAPSLSDRDGGYLRITKIGPRKGDNAPMALLEIIDETVEESRAAKEKLAARKNKQAVKPKKSAAKAAAAEEATGEETEVDTAAEAPYGEDSYRGENPPEGFDIKGNEDSMKYHVPGSTWYDNTVAEVWFADVEAAQAAGFEPAGGADAQTISDETDEADADEAKDSDEA